MDNFFIKNQKGYAILFTVVIVSAVSVITAGLTSAIYKQVILSSLAKDSQSAFYQADTAGDCALYADMVASSIDPLFYSTEHSWSCGDSNLIVTPKTPLESGYNIYPIPTNSESSDPCFRIDVEKLTTGTPPETVTTTKIKARGYNICDKTNSRTVEREIEINY